MKREMRDAIPEVGGLDYTADFADDGVDGGDFEEVYKVLEKKLLWVRNTVLGTTTIKWWCTLWRAGHSQGISLSLNV